MGEGCGTPVRGYDWSKLLIPRGCLTNRIGFDRDLSIAGRAMVKTKDGSIGQRLVKIDRPSQSPLDAYVKPILILPRPVLRIPTLAIHLDRQEKFEFNKETQLFPIAGLVAAELNRQGKSVEQEGTSAESEENGAFRPLKAPIERHHPYLVELIAKEAKVEVSEIQDFEMLLYDTQKSCIGGLNEELLFSPRLDNLGMSFCATVGLIDSLHDSSSLDKDSTIRLISLFDHEEIGSNTAQGADSNMLPSVIERLSMIERSDGEEGETGADSSYYRSLSRSFLVSADMAHSVNPNYAGKYEPDHRPEMNKGTVVKINANARYATNSPGITLIQEVAKRSEVPLQLFVVRNDSSCGSTIGPMLSAALGTRTLDLGNPQLSMHSIRETGGVYDVDYAIKLFAGFFEHYLELQKQIHID